MTKNKRNNKNKSKNPFFYKKGSKHVSFYKRNKCIKNFKKKDTKIGQKEKGNINQQKMENDNNIQTEILNNKPFFDYPTFEKLFFQTLDFFEKLPMIDYYDMKLEPNVEVLKHISSGYKLRDDMFFIRCTRDLVFYDKRKKDKILVKKFPKIKNRLVRQNTLFKKRVKLCGRSLEWKALTNVLMPLSPYFEMRLLFLSFMSIDFRLKLEEKRFTAILLEFFALLPVTDKKKPLISSDLECFWYDRERIRQVCQFYINKSKKMSLHIVPKLKVDFVLSTTKKDALDLFIEKHQLKIPENVVVNLKSRLKTIKLKTVRYWETIAAKLVNYQIRLYFKLLLMLDLVYDKANFLRTKNGVPIIPKGKITIAFYDFVEELFKLEDYKKKVYKELKKYIINGEEEFFGKFGIWPTIQHFSDKNLLK